MEVVLVIELSDLGLLVPDCGTVLVPLLASQSLEQGHFVLTVSRLGQLLSLSQVEGECEQLLSVGDVEAHLVDVLLVFVKRLVGGGEELFVGSEVSLGSLHIVNKSLKLDGVSISSLNSSFVTERDVFKTVDLTEVPEQGVEISSCTLNLEHFLEVGVLFDVLHHLVEQLRLGERVGGVGGEVVGVLVLLRVLTALLFTLVEQAEAAHEVSLRDLDVVSSTSFVGRCETEESSGQLGAYIVEHGESSELSSIA